MSAGNVGAHTKAMRDAKATKRETETGQERQNYLPPPKKKETHHKPSGLGEFSMNMRSSSLPPISRRVVRGTSTLPRPVTSWRGPGAR